MQELQTGDKLGLGLDGMKKLLPFMKQFIISEGKRGQRCSPGRQLRGAPACPFKPVSRGFCLC